MSFAEYSKIQKNYSPLGDQLKDIRALRPKTAPAQDIQKVRKQILDPQPSLLYLQICLFLIFLSLVTYVVLPSTYAHMLVFLLLCVGVAIGFFLMK
jgi:hypothetical protein